MCKEMTRTLFATLLLGYIIFSCQIGTRCGGASVEDIHVLVLLPFKINGSAEQPSYTEGPILLPGAELAVEQINRQHDLLSGYSINLTISNSACDLESHTLVNFVGQFFHSGVNFAGIVGPTCSDAAELLSGITGEDEISILNFHIVSSPRLTDRSQYGYSFGTVGSSQSYVGLFIQLMVTNGWQSVAVLYEESKIFYLSAYSLLVEKLSKVYPQGRISLSIPISEINLPLSSISDHHLRVVFVLSTSELASQMMCLVSRDYPQLTFPAYQFVFMEVRSFYFHYSIDFTYNNRRYSCSVEDITQIMEGFLLSHIKLSLANNLTEIVSGITFEEYIEQYNEKVNGTGTEWANPTYDGMWALALALNNSIPKLNEIDISLSEYSYGMQEATRIIRDEAVKLQFQGASGYISFNNETGYTTASVDLHQLVKNISILVGIYSESDQLLEIYEDGDFVENSFEPIELLIHPALASLFLIFSVIAFILIITTHVLTILYRKFPAIRASSYRLGQLAFIGCYIIGICFICFTVQKVGSLSTVNVTSLCVIQAWCLPLGLTLILGTLTAKTWRLYRIFVHLKKPGKFLTDWVLIVFVLLLTIVDLVLCALWTSLFPFGILLDETITDGNTIEVRVQCNSKHYYIWFGVLTVYQGLIMFFALILALLTKKIRHESFKTKAVTFLVYSLTITLSLGFPIYFVLIGTNVTSVNADYTVLSLTYITVLFLCFGLLFFPPILSLLKAKVFPRLPGLRVFSTEINSTIYKPSSIYINE